MQDVLFLIRGVSGSGKTTMAHKIAEYFNFSKLNICEADDFYFDRQGNYNFDREYISLAHKLCETKAVQLFTKRHPVVVSNTSTTAVEYNKYINYARHRDYTIIIIDMVHEFGNDKNVPEFVLERQRKNFATKLNFPKVEVYHYYESKGEMPDLEWLLPVPD